MPVIDADSHVVETERTWTFMPDEQEEYRPAVLARKSGRTRASEYWLIDDRVFAKNANIGQDTPEAAREAADIAKRVAHMDELGVDVHVLYPSLFLRPLTKRVEVDTALCRSYNRWLASIWRQVPERLRWVVIPPMGDREKALEEIHFGKEHGACGVFVRAFEDDQRISDPYFFPLYAAAQALNLPVCIHASTGNFDHFELFFTDSGFSTFKLSVVGTFHDLLLKRVPAKFPDLRWAFIEVSAQWLPYAMNDLSLRFGKRGEPFLSKAALKENRMYVACQTSDDLDLILERVGDENIVIGTDYGHNDTASELHALRKLRQGGAIGAATANKILWENPKRLYGL